MSSKYRRQGRAPRRVLAQMRAKNTGALQQQRQTFLDGRRARRGSRKGTAR